MALQIIYKKSNFCNKKKTTQILPSLINLFLVFFLIYLFIFTNVQL